MTAARIKKGRRPSGLAGAPFRRRKLRFQPLAFASGHFTPLRLLFPKSFRGYFLEAFEGVSFRRAYFVFSFFVD